MDDSNIFVAITALICMYLSYIILVLITVYLIPALNFLASFSRGFYKFYYTKFRCFKCIKF